MQEFKIKCWFPIFRPPLESLPALASLWVNIGIIFFSEIHKDNHKFLKSSVAIWQEKVFDIYKNSAPLGSNSHTFFMCCAAHQLCFKTAYSERQTLRYFKILSALMGQKKQPGLSLVFWKLIDWKSVKVSEIFLLHCQAILSQHRSEHIILFHSLHAFEENCHFNLFLQAEPQFFSSKVMLFRHFSFKIISSELLYVS